MTNETGIDEEISKGIGCAVEAIVDRSKHSGHKAATGAYHLLLAVDRHCERHGDAEGREQVKRIHEETFALIRHLEGTQR